MINERKITEYWISCDECDKPFSSCNDNIEYDEDYWKLIASAQYRRWIILRAKDDTGDKLFCSIKCMLKYMQAHPEYTPDDVIDTDDTLTTELSKND